MKKIISQKLPVFRKLIFKIFFLLAVGFMTCSLTSAQVWKVIYENSNTDLFDIFFIDSLDGWVVGNNGTLLHSIDGGIPGTNNN